MRLGAGLWRLTAPNAGLMTGSGTNTYLLAGGADSLVIDPGPDDPPHLAALIEAAPAPIGRILLTHTHEDHSPGAARLGALTGARVLGRTAMHAHARDESVRFDRELADGDLLPLAGGTMLRVLHTPGHASNHLCYLLACERLLFTGDHIIEGSTVVIDPPDGDMAAYLDSLKRLLAEDIAWLAPGHGTLIPGAAAAIRALIAHRQRREAQLLAALDPVRALSTEVLLERVYRDLPAALKPVAERSLLAHLLKLESEGLARRSAALWGRC